ncbi:histidine phosphatase family protein [Jeongeupia sp. HS-3]|uniref:SixA phosphatase family protein n=1 Tax=Jeongeupia sp. HS-3 TaxID=1009682 RepID=UPI0019103195|nr:histidine phosphatase family protein [Jeongeupia sp. HS-3]
MEHLILWRHADAEDGCGDDLARALTPKGRKQAQKVAAWLNEQLKGQPMRLIVSEARRAQETAKALGVDIETSALLNPDHGQSAHYLEAAGWPQGRDPVVVLVAHQPTLGAVAALLLTGREQDMALKKGGLVWIELRRRGGSCEYVLRAAITPELLA